MALFLTFTGNEAESFSPVQLRYLAASLNGAEPICCHLKGRGGTGVSVLPCGRGPSFLSICYSLCVSVYWQTHTLQKLGQKKSLSTSECEEPKKMRSWKREVLSAGLQSFLAWHNIRFVMTAYSLLTLTESLARINCAHEFMLPVWHYGTRLSNSAYYGVTALFHRPEVRRASGLMQTAQRLFFFLKGSPNRRFVCRRDRDAVCTSESPNVESFPRMSVKQDINPPHYPFVIHFLVLLRALTGNPLLLMNFKRDGPPQ